MPIKVLEIMIAMEMVLINTYYAITANVKDTHLDVKKRGL